MQFGPASSIPLAKPLENTPTVMVPPDIAIIPVELWLEALPHIPAETFSASFEDNRSEVQIINFHIVGIADIHRTTCYSQLALVDSPA